MKVIQFLIRLFPGLLSFWFGLMKLFGGQFSPNSVKLEEVKELSSPEMVFLFFGHSGIYILIIGLSQVFGGLLLIYKKTSVIGAMLCATVFTNILLINIGFHFSFVLQLFVVFAVLCCLLTLWFNRQKLKQLIV